MSGKRLLIFVTIAFVLFLGVLLIIRGLPKDSDSNGFPSDTSPGEITSVVPTEVVDEGERPTVKLETSSTEWQKEQEQTLTVSFVDLPEPPPTALTLHLIYNPEYVEVVEVIEGDLWTDANVLERKIDNEKGEIMYSAGQGFYADVTGNITLANIKAKAIKSGVLSIETEFELGPESAIASVGINRLIMLQGLPVTIKIKK